MFDGPPLGERLRFPRHHDGFPANAQLCEGTVEISTQGFVPGRPERRF
jgi:hypothetical protein